MEDRVKVGYGPSIGTILWKRRKSDESRRRRDLPIPRCRMGNMRQCRMAPLTQELLTGNKLPMGNRRLHPILADHRSLEDQTLITRPMPLDSIQPRINRNNQCSQGNKLPVQPSPRRRRLVRLSRLGKAARPIPNRHLNSSSNSNVNLLLSPPHSSRASSTRSWLTALPTLPPFSPIPKLSNIATSFLRSVPITCPISFTALVKTRPRD